LIASNTSYITFAFQCGAGEEMADTAFVDLDSYIILEEWIHWGPPGFLSSH